MSESITLPNCLVITPVRNEQDHLKETIESMVKQTVHPLRWVIVNDGSTDQTPGIIDHYAAQHPWIVRLDMPEHRDRSFAAKATCFNSAWERYQDLNFDIVANLDGDISFEPDYLEFLLAKFAEDPELGVAGTPFLEAGDYDSASDSFEGENHVAGGFQLFRRQCFEDVGGYVPNPAGGVDWIAVTTARMKGWKTRSFRQKRFFHHRSLGTAERNRVRAAFSYGEKDYYLGGSPVWEFFRVLYRMAKRPYLVEGLGLAAGYTSAALRRTHRPISPELMRFHRGEQLVKLKLIFRTLARGRRLDAFTVYSSGRSPDRSS